MRFPSLSAAYADGLATLLRDGAPVPSVQDPLSKASNFGLGDRPAREVLSHLFQVEDPHECFVTGPVVRLHLPYCFGLLAFTLAGDSELAALEYYRPGAREFSEDGRTLSGAFGARLQGPSRSADQLASIVQRIRADPGSRRTFAAIVEARDNLSPTLEYPCAAGVQLFARAGRLDLLTVMRAQQALTVLPYDAFLFMSLQLILAAQLGLAPGIYHHFAGTFHVYESELEAVASTVEAGPRSLRLPPLGVVGSDAEELVWRVVDAERQLREAVSAQRRDTIEELLGRSASEPFEQLCLQVLGRFALMKLGVAVGMASGSAVTAPAVPAEFADWLHE